MQLAFHNHPHDFIVMDGNVAYDELLRRSSPDLVKLQVDIHWIVRVGRNPVEFIRTQGKRVGSLHLKDTKPGYSAPTTVSDPRPGSDTEVGHGITDWKTVIKTARQFGVQHYFVEQEFPEKPLDSVRMSYAFLRSIWTS